MTTTPYGPVTASPRVGVGVDVHRLSPGVPMHLAGLAWPDEDHGLEGHSDGDVAAHAACDAALGRRAGDLGSQFGTSDPAWAGGGHRPPRRDLRPRPRGRLAIGNVAVQVMANVRASARRAEAEAALSEAAGAPVIVSATTTDGSASPAAARASPPSPPPSSCLRLDDAADSSCVPSRNPPSISADESG